MIIRPLTEDDRDELVALVRQAFNQPPAFVQRTREMPLENYRGAEVDGRLVACATAIPMGHYFGGAAVACAGVSGVVVAPHARGARRAEAVVAEILREWRSVTPLSSLYPATLPIYRRLGYEFGAYRSTYRVPLARLPRSSGSLAVTPWTDDDLDEVAAAHRGWAAEHNGVGDRTPFYWDRLCRQLGDDPVYRVLVREDGRVTGSLIYHQENGFHMDLVSHDFWWCTPAAARALVTYIAGHYSIGRDFIWVGPSTDPMIFLGNEYDVAEKDRWHLMLRLLDVPAAIGARGYLGGVDAEVTIAVRDDLFAENEGPWRIAVSGGKASVEPAPEAEITLPVGTLASIYSGLLHPAGARRAGLLEGSDAALDRLASVFAGPAPWTPDFF